MRRSNSLRFPGLLALLMATACSLQLLPSAEPDSTPVADVAVVEPLDIMVLEPARPVGRVEPARADRIAFLPLLNHGTRHIHPMLLDAPGHALGVLAALEGDLEVVRPALLETILTEAGQPPWFEADPAFDYDAALLEQIAQETGAGLIVWTELDGDDRVTLRARAFADAAAPDRWQDLRIERDPMETTDRHFFDLPRKLLAGLAERFDRAAQTGVDPLDESAYRQRLQAARQEMWTGQGGRLRRAEERLARLALAEPGRAAAWTELALLRVLRPIALGDEFRHVLMNDGPNVARHFAWLAPDLDPAQAARLRLVDALYVGEGDDEVAYRSLVSGLPEGGMERTILAFVNEREKKSSFALSTEPLPGELGWALTQLAHLEGRSAQREFGYDLLKDEKARALLLSTPILIHNARRQIDTLSRWGQRRPIRAIAQAHGLIEALEVWRDRCLDLAFEPSREACRVAVESWVRIASPDAVLPADTLLDEASWARFADGLFAAFVDPKLGDEAAALLPADSIRATDRAFGGLMNLIEEFIGTANAISQLHNEAGPSLPSPHRLLMTRDRRLLARDVDWMLTTAEQPVRVGKYRGQRDEWEPYSKELERFPSWYTFHDAMLIPAFLDQRTKGKTPTHQEKQAFAAYHPYHMEYVSVAHKALDKVTRPERAAGLEALVPSFMKLVTEAQNLRYRNGDAETALAGLERLAERRAHPYTARIRDKAMKKLGRDAEDRLALLLEAEARFPYEADLVRRVATLALDLERYDVARTRYRAMLGQSIYYSRGCNGLAEIARRENDRAQAERVLLDCAKGAADNFDAAHAWDSIAALRRDQGRLEDAIAASGEAYARVKGASWVLIGGGYIRELMGDFENAEILYRQNDETYKNSASGRLRLALMSIRRQQPADGIALVEDIATNEALHSYNLSDTARLVFVAANELDGFRQFARGLGVDGLVSLAEMEWAVSGDAARAEAILDEAALLEPKCVHVPLVRSRIRRAMGDLEAAVELAQKAHDGLDAFWTKRELFLAHHARGDHAWLEERAREGDRWEMDTWYAAALAAAASGDFETAREKIEWGVTRLYPAKPTGKISWAWHLRPMLLLESTLVGRAGSRDDDERLERDLSFAADHLDYDGRLWKALAAVRAHLGDRAGAALATERMLALAPHRAELKRESMPAMISP